MATLTSGFFLLLFTLKVYPFFGAAKTLIITNNCSYTVWPVVSTSLGSVSHNDSGFALLQGKARVVVVPTSWSGRVWGRTFCTTNKSTGNFSCLAGDCATGKIQCAQYSSPADPVTFAQFIFVGFINVDSYSTTLEDGYNLPMMIIPNVDSGAGCPVSGCVFDDLGSCPTVLEMLQLSPNGNSSVIGCIGPCTTDHCATTNYSKFFMRQCPRAYSFSPNEATFYCDSSRASSFSITFCPSSTMSRLLSTPATLSASPPLPMSAPGPSPSPSRVLSPIPFSPASNSTTKHAPLNSSIVGNKSKKKLLTSLMVALPATVAILVLVFLAICIFNRNRKAARKTNVRTNETEIFADSLQFQFNKIRLATRNFAAENKLGEGGFGEVYKGNLESGQEIAVKRLQEAKNSVQGIAEFETEIVLVAKLQHKNLVKLLGYCTTPKERLLVYEFLPNSSLDKFLMDPGKRSSLNWQTRFRIITGIAKGLLYLHEDSRIKVVHRDLKSSNILLDEDMNPKIADFGLARLFGSDQTQGNTGRIAGTYGYMAPEYVTTGHYSAKSDVYSFGVIVLEIVSGQMNRFFGRLQLEEALLHRAWRLWNKKNAMSLMDTMLRDDNKSEEVLKCIQLGLLCIQENVVDRPKMTSVVASLNGQAISNLPTPKPPQFFGYADDEARDMVDGYAAPATNVYTGAEMITDVYSRD